MLLLTISQDIWMYCRTEGKKVFNVLNVKTNDFKTFLGIKLNSFFDVNQKNMPLAKNMNITKISLVWE